MKKIKTHSPETVRKILLADSYINEGMRNMEALKKAGISVGSYYTYKRNMKTPSKRKYTRRKTMEVLPVAAPKPQGYAVLVPLSLLPEIIKEYL